MKSSVCFLFIYCNPHDHPPNLTLLLSPMQFHSHFFSTSGFNVGTEKKKKKERTRVIQGTAEQANGLQEHPKLYYTTRYFDRTLSSVETRGLSVF